jgi:hypothetical protein
MAADAAIKDLTQLIMSYGDNYRKAFITRRCTRHNERERELADSLYMPTIQLLGSGPWRVSNFFDHKLINFAPRPA